MWPFTTTVPPLERDHLTLGPNSELSLALPLLFCGVGILNSSAARQFPVSEGGILDVVHMFTTHFCTPLILSSLGTRRCDRMGK